MRPPPLRLEQGNELGNGLDHSISMPRQQDEGKRACCWFRRSWRVVECADDQPALSVLYPVDFRRNRRDRRLYWAMDGGISLVVGLGDCGDSLVHRSAHNVRKGLCSGNGLLQGILVWHHGGGHTFDGRVFPDCGRIDAIVVLGARTRRRFRRDVRYVSLYGR